MMMSKNDENERKNDNVFPNYKPIDWTHSPRPKGSSMDEFILSVTSSSYNIVCLIQWISIYVREIFLKK